MKPNLRSLIRARGFFVLLCASLVPALVWADGVTRSVEPVAGGCKVTLAWTFSGKVESDLILEERFAQGWAAVDATVPFGSLDASWFSGGVVRFAVKPELLAKAGEICFTVAPRADAGEDAYTTGTVRGEWKLYLDGTLRKGAIGGDSVVQASSPARTDTEASSPAAAPADAVPVAIASFKVLAGGRIELSYAAVAQAGTLVVEGCAGLGKSWTELKRTAVASGDGKVYLETGEIRGCSFFRLLFIAGKE